MWSMCSIDGLKVEVLVVFTIGASAALEMTNRMKLMRLESEGFPWGSVQFPRGDDQRYFSSLPTAIFPNDPVFGVNAEGWF